MRRVDRERAFVHPIALSDREEIEAVLVVGHEHDARSQRLAVDDEVLAATPILQRDERAPAAARRSRPAAVAARGGGRAARRRPARRCSGTPGRRRGRHRLAARLRRGTPRAPPADRRYRARRRSRSGCACPTGCRRRAGLARSATCGNRAQRAVASGHAQHLRIRLPRELGEIVVLLEHMDAHVERVARPRSAPRRSARPSPSPG